MAQMFTGFSRDDDYKVPDTAYYGGFQIKDMELQARIKAAGYEIMKSVGKKILSGDLNITSVSFPIKCMCPTSLLKKVQGMNKVLPFYLNYAASLEDPVERMRAVIAASVAFLWKNHDFDKPLNPILGETYQARMADGGMLYAE